METEITWKVSVDPAASVKRESVLRSHNRIYFCSVGESEIRGQILKIRAIGL